MDNSEWLSVSPNFELVNLDLSDPLQSHNGVVLPMTNNSMFSMLDLVSDNSVNVTDIWGSLFINNIVPWGGADVSDANMVIPFVRYLCVYLAII